MDCRIIVVHDIVNKCGKIVSNDSATHSKHDQGLWKKNMDFYEVLSPDFQLWTMHLNLFSLFGSRRMGPTGKAFMRAIGALISLQIFKVVGMKSKHLWCQVRQCFWNWILISIASSTWRFNSVQMHVRDHILKVLNVLQTSISCSRM